MAYQEYNDMLHDLYLHHTDPQQIYIKLKFNNQISTIKRKAINHFLAKLRVQGWIIDIDEYVEASDEPYLSWKEDEHYIIIYGNLRSKL